MALPARAQVCPATPAVDLSAILLPPPCDTCAGTKAELDELIDLQKTRTPDQAEHAKADHKKTIKHFLQGIVPDFSPDRFPLTGALFECVARSAAKDVKAAKNQFHRTRPYNLPGNGIELIKDMDKEDSFAYPSGHATFGAVAGVLLAEMIPERRVAIYNRILDYGMSRMIAGAHFRSDVTAGQLSGAAIAASMLGSPAFRAEFDKATAEVRQAAGAAQ